MKYESSDLQELMDKFESIVQNIENNQNKIFESQQFKFTDAYYHELITIFTNRGYEYTESKQIAQSIIDNTEIDIKDNEYVSDKDIVKSAKHFAHLTYRIIELGEQNNIPWFSASQCGLEFKLE